MTFRAEGSGYIPPTTTNRSAIRRVPQALGSTDRTLVVHINRRHLYQELIETFMEMSVAYAVKTLVYVVTEDMEAPVLQAISNIRASRLEVLVVRSFVPQGKVVILTENAPTRIDRLEPSFDADTIIVGPDSGSMPQYGGIKVCIPVLAKNHLWSFQVAAIGLYALTKEARTNAINRTED